MTDLVPKLEASIEAARTGGAFVARFDLPDENDLAEVHAQLARVIRSQRRIRGRWVLPMPVSP